MKKILVLLLLLIASPVFAQQCTVTRFQKELNDAVKPYISTEHTMMDPVLVTLDTLMNKYIWRPGWSQTVQADILPGMDCKPITPPISVVEEQQVAEILRSQYIRTYKDLLTQLRQHPEIYKKYTQAQVNQLLGK